MSDNNQFELVDETTREKENTDIVVDTDNSEVNKLTSGEHHHHHYSSHHHSSHHNSGHHSGHHGKHHNKSKKKKIRFSLHLSKKDKKNVGIIAVEIAVALVACIALVVVNHFGNNNDNVTTDNVVIDSGFVVKMPELPEAQPIVDDVIISCMELNDGASFQTFLKPFRHEGLRFDVAKPVMMDIIFNNIPDGTAVSQYKVYISKKTDLSDARILDFTADQKIEINYLEVNTKYYYKVMALPTDYSVGGSFTTADTPRILNIDGIYNVRDIGGWKTVDGKVIKQGLLYRGTELDGQVNSEYTLTEKGKNVMLNVLNIKFDMDLRSSSMKNYNIDMLGETVTHKYYSARMYGDIFTEEGQITTKNIFSDLAKPENYPMYMHCTHGADRAGTICYLLEALLGLSETDLEKEYELSTLYHSHISRDLLNELKTGLMMYEGKTIQEKTENYLLSIGVTEVEIQTIKDILLEKASNN